MAEWTIIPDDVLEPGKPIRSVDAIALRDNPVAIADGAAGAPKIKAAGLDTTSNERDWVLARTAAATAGAVGTYMLLMTRNNSGAGDEAAGTTRAGSTLIPFGFRSDDVNENGTAQILTSRFVVGTWRCMGYSPAIGVIGTAARSAGTLWLRIS